MTTNPPDIEVHPLVLNGKCLQESSFGLRENQSRGGAQTWAVPSAPVDTIHLPSGDQVAELTFSLVLMIVTNANAAQCVPDLDGVIATGCQVCAAGRPGQPPGRVELDACPTTFAPPARE